MSIFRNGWRERPAHAALGRGILAKNEAPHTAGAPSRLSITLLLQLTAWEREAWLASPPASLLALRHS